MDFSTPKTYKICGVAQQNNATRKCEKITYTRENKLPAIPTRKNTTDRSKIHGKMVPKTWAFLIRHSSNSNARGKLNTRLNLLGQHAKLGVWHVKLRQINMQVVKS